MAAVDKIPLLLGKNCENKAGAHFTLAELKMICRDLGLHVSGTKSILCQRIREHLAIHTELVLKMMNKYGTSTTTQTKQKHEPSGWQWPEQPIQPTQKRQHPQKHEPSGWEWPEQPMQQEQTKQKSDATGWQWPEQPTETRQISHEKVGEKKLQRYQTLEEMMKDYNIADMKLLVNLSGVDLEKLINIIELHDGKVKMRDLVKGKKIDQKIKILVEELAGKLCRCIDKIDSKRFTVNQRIAICIASIFHSKGITISRFICQPIPMLIPKSGQTSVIRKYDPTS